jgi:hypothetical protein
MSDERKEHRPHDMPLWAFNAAVSMAKGRPMFIWYGSRVWLFGLSWNDGRVWLHLGPIGVKLNWWRL